MKAARFRMPGGAAHRGGPKSVTPTRRGRCEVMLNDPGLPRMGPMSSVKVSRKWNELRTIGDQLGLRLSVSAGDPHVGTWSGPNRMLA